MSRINKLILCIAVIIFVGGLSYTITAVYYGLDKGVECSINGFDEKSQIIARLEKIEENNKYYLKIIQNPSTTEQAYVTISCTKKQYDFIKNKGTYHITYKRKLFDKNKGKLLKLDTNTMFKR